MHVPVFLVTGFFCQKRQYSLAWQSMCLIVNGLPRLAWLLVLFLLVWPWANHLTPQGLYSAVLIVHLPCTRQHDSKLREGSQLKEILSLVGRKLKVRRKREKRIKENRARKGVWGGLTLKRKQDSVYLTISCFHINLIKERAQEIALILGQLLFPVSRKRLPIIPRCIRALAAAVAWMWGGGALLINQGCREAGYGYTQVSNP